MSGRARIDAISDDNLSAFLAQPPRCCTADALAGAGHNANLLGQPASARRPDIKLNCHEPLLHRQGRFDAFARERQIAKSVPRGSGERIGERRCGGALGRFSAPQKRLPRPVKNMDSHAVRDRIETKDRVGGPIDAGDARVVEGYAFVKGPADRLDDAAFDLVDQSVGIDRLPRIDGSDRTQDAGAAGIARHLHFHGNCAIGCEFL